MTMDMKQKLSKKIQKAYFLSEKAAERKAAAILEKCPPQLMPNVIEWCSDEKLTDILVGKYSVPMIMAVWGRQDFIGALEVIIEFLHGDAEAAEYRIWQMRR